MFEGLKGLAGVAGLMKDMPRIKASLEEVKSRLGDMRVSADAGGGAVRATVTGKMRVASIEVEPSILAGLIASEGERTNSRMAAELIAGAVNAALEKAQKHAAEEFASAAEELGLPIPPGGLAGFM